MLPERPGIVIRVWYRWRDSDRLLYNSYIMLNTKIKTEHYKSYFVSQLGRFILKFSLDCYRALCSQRSLVLPVRVWGRGPEAERGQRGRGEAGVAPVSPLTSVWPPGVRDGARGRLLDVHPQPVDLPRGRGQVTLQLQLPLTQSAMSNY